MPIDFILNTPFLVYVEIQKTISNLSTVSYMYEVVFIIKQPFPKIGNDDNEHKWTNVQYSIMLLLRHENLYHVS